MKGIEIYKLYDGIGVFKFLKNGIWYMGIDWKREMVFILLLDL